MNAVLYARVSTEEQVKKFSLRQQLEALRDYCTSEGIEILEEVADEGFSGAYMERPGLDRVRDLVEAGDVDIVLVQDRDRLSREPAYVFFLNKEFVEHGTRVMALNQRGDETPEGQLTDGIIDQIAKFERAKTMERTRRGRLRKAKEGKVVGNGKDNFGFKRVGDYYQINPEEMAVMHRIFKMVAGGKTLYEIATLLERQGIKSPRGGTLHRSKIRPLILKDVYKPHSVEELSTMVSPTVLQRLDPSKRYGVLWYSRSKRESKMISEMVNGERIYKRKTKTVEKLREEWVAIPVPDSGIPREMVDKARENILGNQRFSRNGGRLWELTGGVAVCGVCGRRMTTVSIPRKGGSYNYYRCSGIVDKTCKSKNHRAEKLEMKALGVLQDLFSDRGKIKLLIRDHFDNQISDLKRKDPKKESKKIMERIAKLQQNRSNAQDLAIDGLLSKDQLREKTEMINDEISILEKELGKLSDQKRSIASLERKKQTLIELQEFSTLYDIGLIEDADDWFEGGSKTRHKLYKDLGIKVYVYQEDIRVEIDGEYIFSKCESAS